MYRGYLYDTWMLTSLRRSKDSPNLEEYIQLSGNPDESDQNCEGRLLSLKTVRRLATAPNRLLSEFGIKYLCERSFATYEYAKFAVQCDYSLAVRLARTANVNPALFLPPISRHLRRLRTDEEPITSMLEQLNQQPNSAWSRMPTARHFIKQALLIAEVLATTNLGAHHLELDYIEKNRHFTAENFDWAALQAMLACSTCDSNVCRVLIEKGIFLILHDLRDKYATNPPVLNCIAMILSNLSAHKVTHSHFFVTGWLQVLVQWMQSNHLELQLHSAKILYNLDRPDSLLSPSVYLLSPVHRRVHYDYDIVFVHGLLGSVFKTWRQDQLIANVPNEEQMEASDGEGSKIVLWSKFFRSWSSDTDQESKSEKYTRCWPRDWLAPQLRNVRVLGVNYQTHLSDWLIEHPMDSKTIEQRAKEVLSELKQAGVGQRPIVWVSHSMGGLLVKQILLQSTAIDDPPSPMITNTKGVVFYSVPHYGADLTHWPLKFSRLVLPSEEVRALQKNSPLLLQLQHHFRQLAAEHRIKILSVSESLKSRITAKGLVFEAKLVPDDSNLFDAEQSYVLEQDHFHICKPSSRSSASYQLTLQFIRSVLSACSDSGQTNLFYYSPVDLWPPVG
jgi:pimeloyl-ACP methyl ester carboxylesterase